MEVYMSLLIYLTQNYGSSTPTEKIVEASVTVTKSYRGWYILALNNADIVNSYFNNVNQPVIGSHIFSDTLSMPTFTMRQYQSSWYSIQISQFNPDVNDTLEYLFQDIGTHLIGVIPPIWTYPKYQALPHAGCFASCTGLENYNEIPDDWK